MRALASPLTGVVVAMLLLGCSACTSKTNETKDAQPAGQPAPAAGPLASLEAEPFAQETWSVGGQPTPMLYWARHDVRVSASCRSADAKLRCEALQQLRGAPAIEVPRRALDGRTSAGVKACMQTGRAVLVARSPSGDEDSFCRFQDGSLVAAGALETYGIRVTE